MNRTQKFLDKHFIECVFYNVNSSNCFCIAYLYQSDKYQPTTNKELKKTALISKYDLSTLQSRNQKIKYLTLAH